MRPILSSNANMFKKYETYLYCPKIQDSILICQDLTCSKFTCYDYVKVKKLCLKYLCWCIVTIMYNYILAFLTIVLVSQTELLENSIKVRKFKPSLCSKKVFLLQMQQL